MLHLCQIEQLCYIAKSTMLVHWRNHSLGVSLLVRCCNLREIIFSNIDECLKEKLSNKPLTLKANPHILVIYILL